MPTRPSIIKPSVSHDGREAQGDSSPVARFACRPRSGKIPPGRRWMNSTTPASTATFAQVASKRRMGSWINSSGSSIFCAKPMPKPLITTPESLPTPPTTTTRKLSTM